MSHIIRELQSFRLLRIDPAANMARFYEAWIERDLLGFVLVRKWGRIGTCGRHLRAPFATRGEAEACRATILGRKLRRGYRPRGTQLLSESFESALVMAASYPGSTRASMTTTSPRS
jgi:predicted DNA-binding WGR domain protein